MDSNDPVITNVFDTDWCNHLWGDTNPASASAKGVTMESRHVNLQRRGPEPAYVSFKNKPEHRELLKQEVHVPPEMPVVGNSSVYPLQPGRLQNSSKNAVNQRDLQGLHFHTNSDSRRSRARFSREEESALLAGVVERWDELYGYRSQALPRGAKSRIWSDIAARLSGSSGEAREGEDVRKKWLYVKLTLKNRLRSAGQLGPGAGAYPPDLSPLEQRVLALMGHDSGGGVDAPDHGFGPVSGEDFRHLASHGPEDPDTVGSTGDTDVYGSGDERPEEPTLPPSITAPVSVPSPVPVSTTAYASAGQRRSACPEDPLAPALAAIGSRQDRSISLHKEAVGVLRSLAADVRRYVDHMLAATAPSQGASASTQPTPPAAASTPPARVPQARSPPPPQTPAPNPAPSLHPTATPAEHPPGSQPPCGIPTCVHPQSGIPLPQTVPQYPTCSFPPQYPPLCPYHIMPPFPAVAYPAYYPGPQSTVYHLPQQTPPTAAPHIYHYPPAVTIVAPPPFYSSPSPSAPHTVIHHSPPPSAPHTVIHCPPPPSSPHTVIHHSPPPSFYPSPPRAPAAPAQPAANCTPLSDCRAAPRTPGTPPPASAQQHQPRGTQQRRGRGWIRKRWGRREGWSCPSGRAAGLS